MILLTSGRHFVVFLSRVFATNLSLHNINSINCMVAFGVGDYARGMVVWVAYDTQHIGFKHRVTVASLGITCARQ